MCKKVTIETFYAKSIPGGLTFALFNVLTYWEGQGTISVNVIIFLWSLNSCRRFFYFTSESKFPGVCWSTTNVAFYLLLIWLGFFNNDVLTYWLKRGWGKLHKTLLWHLKWRQETCRKGACLILFELNSLSFLESYLACYLVYFS